MSSKIKTVTNAHATLGDHGHHVGKLAHCEAQKRASKALSNARQRCGNKKNPDYPGYGGCGIRVLIESVDRLISLIGLPKPGYSLDRINPLGHYEVGNVRWVTPAVQAANKKASGTNAHLTLSFQIAAAKEAMSLGENRRDTVLGWVRIVGAYNSGHLPLDHAHWMAEHLPRLGLIAANFDVDTVHDYANASPGYAHLPALSLPNERVRIRCGPASRMPASSATMRMGRLAGLEELSPEWNVPTSVWKRVRSIVEGEGAGTALIGSPSLDDLEGGWIEGSLLAAASSLAANLGVTTAFYPLLRVQKMLSDLGSPDWWDDEDHQLLSARVLLIPDLLLDCGRWGDSKAISWWKVGALLRRRYEDGLQTIVGVQNPARLPAAVKEIVLGAYELMPMPRTPPHSCDEIQFANAHFGVPPGSVALRDLKADNKLSRLVSQYELIEIKG